jgi:hypothetical protein
MTRECFHCEFFELLRPTDQRFDPVEGECHRRSPRLQPDGEFGSFPKMSPFDWCGDFRMRAEAIAAAANDGTFDWLSDFRPMSADELAEIRTRCRNATPGKWAIVNDADTTCDELICLMNHEDLGIAAPYDCVRPVWCSRDDAIFIAHSRQDVPRLLNEVLRLRASLQQRTETEQPATAE